MLIRPVVGAGAILAVLVAAFPGVANAATDSHNVETSITSWQNHDRAARSIPPLRSDDRLHRIAREHAENMAHAHDVWHQENLADVVPQWQSLGDNVGRGDSAEAIYATFLESEQHRANILDPAFALTGVGAAYADDGALYVAVVFIDPADVVQAPSRSNTTAVHVQRAAPVAHPQAPRAATSVARVERAPISPTETVTMVVQLASISDDDNGLESKQARTREIG